MNPFTIEIDGKEYQAAAGDTILQVARNNGFGHLIPTLCEEPGLPHQTSCFVCVVEVEGLPKLAPACSTPVAPDMKIRTNSEKVIASRKTALELLLSNHPADCVGPCVLACPAHVEVQKYVALANAGQYEQAIRVIRENNPLVSVCGRVCVRRCEDDCRRALYEGPVGVNMVKRYLGDWEMENPVADTPGPETGKKVAIVGGGPAGLTAAYYLRLMGHGVELFDSQKLLGGMLRFGIPDYRLPDRVLDHEVNHILGLGVKVNLNQKLGKDYTLDQLRNNFDAVFLGVGAWQAMPGRIKGEDHPQVVKGIDFLYEVKNGDAPDIAGKKVSVIGGGNTAIDAARTAVRLGAAEVNLLYRRTRKEMPAHEEEIVGAEHEGVNLQILVAPVLVQGSENELEGLVCQKMELGEPDASGRRRPVPIEGSEYLIQSDYAILAIGQRVEQSDMPKDPALTMTQWGTLEVDETTGTTTLPGVFAAGDNVTGPSVAIAAIGNAHVAALGIHAYLTGSAMEKPDFLFKSQKKDFGPITTENLPPVEKAERAAQPEMDGALRSKSFEEAESTLPLDKMLDEANRCLRCGCAAQNSCTLRNLAEKYDVTHAFSGDANTHLPDLSNPRIVLDSAKCILCGRCIRICSDVVKVHALSFVDRGFDTRLAPAMGKPLAESPCISCGNCVESCPTGALSFYDPWDSECAEIETDSVCLFCGNGCDINVRQTAFGISIGAAHDENGVLSPICALGRFGHRILFQVDRITRPMVRKNGELTATSWDEAISAAANGMKKAAKAGRTLIGVSPTLTSEQAFTAGILADALKTDDLYCLTESQNAMVVDTETGMPVLSTASFADLMEAKCILYVGPDHSEQNPIMASRIIFAQRHGAKVVAVTPKRTRMAKLADLWISPKAGTAHRVLTWLAEAAGNSEPSTESISNETGVEEKLLSEIRTLLIKSEGPFVAVNNPDGNSENCNALLALQEAIAQNRKAGVIFGVTNGNTIGVSLAGAKTTPDAKALWKSGEIKGAWLMGEDPFTLFADNVSKPDFMVVQDFLMTEAAQKADVVLPITALCETGGTVVLGDGTVKVLQAGAPSLSAFENHQIIEKAVALINPDYDRAALLNLEPAFSRFIKEKAKVRSSQIALNNAKINGINRDCPSSTGIITGRLEKEGVL